MPPVKKRASRKNLVKTNKSAKTRAAALPVWDLSDLVPAPAARHIAAGLAAAGKKAAAFQAKYENKTARLSAAAFGKAFADYESICEGLGRLGSYVSLDRQTRLDDPAAGQLYQSVSETINDISARLVFFRLEINRAAEATVKTWLKHKDVARYRPVLTQIRAFRPYQLPDEVEKILHDRDVTGASAWMRMFDETSARLRFPFRGKELTETEIFHHLLSHDAAARREAHASIGRVMKDNAGTFGLILNTLAKEKEVDERQRGFKSIMASRNLDNQVEDEVVEALTKAVRQSHKRLSHRYYRLKAKWLGKAQLDIWDRNAPLPFAAKRKITWPQAQKVVLDAYGMFHPQMARTGARFFENSWIDAQPRAGKDSGAFSASTVPAAHPYILMNFKGGLDDVMTLAHELGHGVHQVLAADQGYFMADTPLTLAETASVFGEMLVFQSLLAAETDPVARRALLARKVEDMLNTVVRQVAFHDFECEFHTRRKKGELTPQQTGEIWMRIMRQSLGPAFRFDDHYRYFWAYISHFYHSPFYVYAYAFGDCLVNALYMAYRDSEKKGDKSFADKYIALLAAGGTKHHRDLLRPFGLNAADPAFWRRGLALIESFIDQLESGENAVTLDGKRARRDSVTSRRRATS
ncbi:MAG: M3 family oligoendopeptidase [Alphaproteobacteria bacterium]|nr:M3 family oligoendopeptidase [Alphaproteobacteria bacterium]